MPQTLTEYDSKKFFESHGIKVPLEKVAHSRFQAVRAAKELGYPVVMKIISPDISHKTEAKGVKTNVEEHDVGQTYEELVKNAKDFNSDARIDGVSVQQQVTGVETIIGTSIDPQFGQTIMFGIGGIFVELLKDVTFRIIPIERKDAKSMIEDIREKKLFEGFRNSKPVNKNAIVDVLLKVSRMVEKNPQIKELDINPLFVNENEAVAADGRIVLEWNQ